MASDVRALLIDVLEDAAFKGTWRHSPELTALEAAMETADVILAGLTVSSDRSAADAERLEGLRRTRAMFVEQMTTAPALDPVRPRRGPVVWPKGSVGWWNERVRACDDVIASFEQDAVIASQFGSRAKCALADCEDPVIVKTVHKGADVFLCERHGLEVADG